MKKQLLAAASFLALVSGAMAADLPNYKAPPAAPIMTAYNWTGFYLGLNAGYAWTQSSTVTIVGGGVQNGVSQQGGLLGVHAGYDYQFSNNVVIGARLNVPILSSVSGNQSVFNNYNSKLNWAVIATGSIGYAFDRVLPYIGGGVVFAQNTVTETFTNPNVSNAQNHTGYTLLAGIKYAITDKWSIGVQYNYTNLGSQTYTFGAPANGQAKASATANSISALISYKF